MQVHKNPTGDELLRILAALGSPQRLRVVAELVAGRSHVSELARRLGMSRPLLYLHLQRLDAAGLLKSRLELSDDGKAMRYFEVEPFILHLTPERIAEAVETLTMGTREEEG